MLATLDLVPPRLVVQDGDAPHRQRTQERLQAHPPLVGVPLVVVASERDIDSFTAALTRGAAAYLAKPVDAAELREVARRLVGWSDSTGRSERRRRLRRPLLMKVDLDVHGREGFLEGQLLDVSSRGCRLETPVELSRGTRVRVVLRGLEQSTHVALGAVVAWSQGAGGRHLLGCRFTGTTAVMAAKLLGVAPPPPPSREETDRERS